MRVPMTGFFVIMLAAVLVSIFACSTVAARGPEDPGEQSARAMDPRPLGVWRLVPDIESETVDGKPFKLSDIKSAKVIVIAFTSTTCPITRKQAPTLARLEAEYKPQGVVFVYVNAEPADTAEDMREQIKTHGFQGVYLPDRDRRVAKALGVRTTTEVFVLDAARTLQYRGAIDDQYGFGYSLPAPRNTHLVNAISAVSNSMRPPIQATWSPGCLLEQSPIEYVPPLTYHSRVSRIIANSCLDCHHDGGVGPFALDTYESVARRGPMIQYVLDKGMMPPWHALPPAPGEASKWSNDRSLSATDKVDLLSWLAGDKALGSPADAAVPRAFPTQWSIGEPDVILQIPDAIAIKADGQMPYQYARVDTNYGEDRWVQALEVLPGSRAVVHHVLVFALPKGTDFKRPRELRGMLDETRGFFAAYVPGNGSVVYPRNFAKRLPAGSSLLFQIHYTPNGAATTDQTKLGLVFAPEQPAHVVRTHGIANTRLNIPPGSARHEVRAEMIVPSDVRILAYMPHTHIRGIAARYEAKPPNAMKMLLLDVPTYDFNWQNRYMLREPVAIAAGTELSFTAWYNNSASNPANPDPAARVRWGQQTTDEMHLGYVEYYLENEDYRDDPDGLVSRPDQAKPTQAP